MLNVTNSVYVLYNHSRLVLAFLGSFLVVQIAVSIFLFTFPGSTGIYILSKRIIIFIFLV